MKINVKNICEVKEQNKGELQWITLELNDSDIEDLYGVNKTKTLGFELENGDKFIIVRVDEEEKENEKIQN